MGARSGGGTSAGSSRGGGGGFGSGAKKSASGGRKSNPFSASAAMKVMGVDKNMQKLLKSGMFGF